MQPRSLPRQLPAFPCGICPTATGAVEHSLNPQDDEKQTIGLSEHCLLYSKRCLSASVEIFNLPFMYDEKACAIFMLRSFPSVDVQQK